MGDPDEEVESRVWDAAPIPPMASDITATRRALVALLEELALAESGGTTSAPGRPGNRKRVADLLGISPRKWDLFRSGSAGLLGEEALAQVRKQVPPGRRNELIRRWGDYALAYQGMSPECYGSASAPSDPIREFRAHLGALSGAKEARRYHVGTTLAPQFVEFWKDQRQHRRRSGLLQPNNNLVPLEDQEVLTFLGLASEFEKERAAFAEAARLARLQSRFHYLKRRRHRPDFTASVGRVYCEWGVHVHDRQLVQRGLRYFERADAEFQAVIASSDRPWPDRRSPRRWQETQALCWSARALHEAWLGNCTRALNHLQRALGQPVLLPHAPDHYHAILGRLFRVYILLGRKELALKLIEPLAKIERSWDLERMPSTPEVVDLYFRRLLMEPLGTAREGEVPAPQPSAWGLDRLAEHLEAIREAPLDRRPLLAVGRAPATAPPEEVTHPLLVDVPQLEWIEEVLTTVLGLSAD